MIVINVGGYIRISSKTNENGDSKDRQLLAIKNYAKANDMKIVRCDADIGVRGSTNIFDRKGLRELFEFCLENDIKIILTENASRFARDQMVGEWGFRELKKHGIQIVPVDSPDYYTLENDDPMVNLIRQVLGSIAEFEKNSLVAKLRGARERIKAEKGKCGGRKSLEEIYGETKFKSLVKRTMTLKGSGLSLARIADGLWDEGWMQPSTLRPYNKSQIRRLIQLGE